MTGRLPDRERLLAWGMCECAVPGCKVLLPPEIAAEQDGRCGMHHRLSKRRKAARRFDRAARSGRRR